MQSFFSSSRSCPNANLSASPEDLFQRARAIMAVATCPQEFSQALNLYRQAAEQGHSQSLLQLADCYTLGKGIEQNQRKAFEAYNLAAAHELLPASYLLGLCYLHGFGCQTDVEKAVENLQKAADCGHEQAALVLPHAYYMLGNFYHKKILPLSSQQLALEYYRKAYAAGYVQAKQQLFELSISQAEESLFGYDKNAARALELFEQACDLGYVEASQKVIDSFKKYAKYLSLKARFMREWQALEAGFQLAMRYGNNQAQQLLGLLYLKLAKLREKAAPCDKSAQQAFAFYQKAADYGLKIVYVKLAESYLQGIGVAKNRSKALEYYHLAALDGNLASMHILANIHQQQNNPAKALLYTQMAADHGCVESMYQAALTYYQGKDLPPNHARAADYFRDAIQHEHSQATVRLICRQNKYIAEAIEGETDWQSALQTCREQAEQGDAQAQCKLARCYQNAFGVERDFKKATSWFRKASLGGNSYAKSHLAYWHEYAPEQFEHEEVLQAHFMHQTQCDRLEAHNYLGCHYALNSWFADNLKLAIKHFKKAADQGHVLAQANLGMLFLMAKDVVINGALAVKYLQAAADQGDELALNMLPSAYYELGLAYKGGWLHEGCHKKAFIFFSKAASDGHELAMLELGNYYENAKVVSYDPAQAASWYYKAAALGNRDALERLEQLRSLLELE